MSKDFWTKGEDYHEVIRTTTSIGSRHSLLGRTTVYKLRVGSVNGVNGWSTRSEAHIALALAGYVRAPDFDERAVQAASHEEWRARFEVGRNGA